MTVPIFDTINIFVNAERTQNHLSGVIWNHGKLGW